jgi:hypothetical protein
MAELHLRSSKRQKLVISSVGLAVALSLASFWPLSGWSIIPLLILSYLATAWVFDFDLRGREWFILPLYILLTSTAAYIGLLWYGHNMWLHWTEVVMYCVIVYGLLLTLNILNVATVRALPLARQALTFLSLAGVIGLFVLTYIILALRPNLLEWSGAVAIIATLIAWPLIWGAKLGQGSSRAEIGWTLLVTLLGLQLAAAVGLWPISFMTSLAVAGGISICIGLIHHHLNRQLTQPLQQQYLFIGGVLLVVFYAMTQWI